MDENSLENLELMAEVDALIGRLKQWRDDAPDWRPAEMFRAVVERLVERTDSLRVRIDAPLIVATLGGTGTGKSTLINAILGSEVVRTGRERPTTTRPMVICREGITPEMLGIDPAGVEVIQCDLPILSDLVLIDCPDPDTSEVDRPGSRSASGSATNLARLRGILPHCDVLLVTATQQKYRSACVRDELMQAALGARVIFVQTHAGIDNDIRDDWRSTLSPRFDAERIFFVDSQEAYQRVRDGAMPTGDFGDLLKLLTRSLAGSAAARIRRANFLDLVADALARCRARYDESHAAVETLWQQIQQRREDLAGDLADRIRRDLPDDRRQWEHLLLGETASRWGVSPMSIVLRVYHGLGGWLVGTMLLRSRSVAQAAIWGTVGGIREIRRRSSRRRATAAPGRTISQCWGTSRLRKDKIELEGYADEAGLSTESLELSAVRAEAERAGDEVVAHVSDQLQNMIRRLAKRHTGWFTRLRYEFLLGAMLIFLLFRLGKNFFWDSWLAGEPVEVHGLDLYLAAAFWLLLWCVLLTWMLTRRLRRGLAREINLSAETWLEGDYASGLFGGLERHCDDVKRFGVTLRALQEEVNRLRRDLAVPPDLG